MRIRKVEETKLQAFQVEFQLEEFSIFSREALESMYPENKQLKKVIFAALNNSVNSPPQTSHVSMRDKVLKAKL